MDISRRHFIKTGTTITASLAIPGTIQNMLSSKQKSWGIQLFTIPAMVSKDLKGTLKQLSEIGYKEIEFFGPYDFSAPETLANWEAMAGQLGITQNAFYGHSISEIKELLSSLGLSTPSVHLDLLTLRTVRESAIEKLAELGTKYVVLPTLPDPASMEMDDFRKLAEEYNQIGKAMSSFGLSLVHHNHGYEHWTDGKTTPMEVLLENTDPDTVKFELDIFWMKAGGADPVDFLSKYPGRFKLMHVKDAQEEVRFSADGKTFGEWMALFPKMTDPGKGVFDIEKIVEVGVKSGVDHFYLERDLAPSPETTLKDSFEYFSKL